MFVTLVAPVALVAFPALEAVSSLESLPALETGGAFARRLLVRSVAKLEPGFGSGRFVSSGFAWGGGFRSPLRQGGFRSRGRLA